MFTKAESRLQFKAMRDRLDDVQYEQLNQQLLHTFKEVSLDHVEYLHLFLPILLRREPDTYKLIAYLRKDFPEIKIVISKSKLETNHMKHYLFHKDMTLIANQWGIVEPEETSAEEVQASVIDMVLMPLLAFDLEGNRVGYGKGYYDIFLRSCKSDVQKIGISLFSPLDRIADIQVHDVPLDACVTPQKLWKFSK